MRLAEHIKLKQIKADAGFLLQPVGILHPPSLKNPQKVKRPASFQPKDLPAIMNKVRRQVGRPTVSQGAQIPVFPPTTGGPL